jgi:hypothetical protein
LQILWTLLLTDMACTRAHPNIATFVVLTLGNANKQGTPSCVYWQKYQRGWIKGIMEHPIEKKISENVQVLLLGLI